MEHVNKNIPVKSYISPKVAIRKSPIHGLGMFSISPIQQHEIVFIKGGHILSRKDMFSSKVINSYLPLDDDYFLAAICADEEESIKLFLNHSCDPNCGVRGEITFVAIRYIGPGEELVCDYAMIDNESYKFMCSCGSQCCRGEITGYDWKLKHLQKKYSNYFSRYLLEKMSNPVNE